MSCIRRFAHLCVLTILILPLPALAEDSVVADAAEKKTKLPEVVVTATRTETSIEEIGRSIDAREADELQETQSQTLADSLDTVAGVRAFDLGGPGAPGVTPIEIRGFRTSGTQLLLNGLPLADPSSVAGTFDAFFPYFSTDGVASVEVLRGGTGVLYGSDGQAGAVNIRTLTPADGLHGGGRIEAGAYETLTESAQFNYGADWGNIVGSVTRADSAGMDDHGDFENTNAFISGEYKFSEWNAGVTPFVLVVNGGTDLDTSPTADEAGNLIPNLDTPRNHVDNLAVVYGATIRTEPVDRLVSKLSLYSVYSDRDYLFDFGFGDFKSNFLGQLFASELENVYDLREFNSQIIGGLRYEHQSARTDDGTLSDSQSRDNYAFFLYDQTELIENVWHVAGGYRYTYVGQVDDSISTLELSSVVNIAETGSKLHASVQQGFRAPTLYESTGKTIDFNTGEVVTVGNRSLNEEETLGFDVGVGQHFFGKQLYIDETFFLIDADETILFDFVNNRHLNGGGGQTRGLETSASWSPSEWYRARLAYTYLDQADGLNGLRTQRRPYNWYTLTNYFNWNDVQVAATLRYRSSQELEFFGVADRVKEGDATLVDIAGSYPICDQIEAYLRFENVFDVKYTEAGYQMPRGSVYAGLRFKL